MNLAHAARARPAGAAAAAFLLALVALALLGPILMAANPDSPVGTLATPPSAEHWLGTDLARRDVLARLLSAAAPSLGVAAVAVTLSATIGAVSGAIAGLTGGWIDRAVSATGDVILALPRLVLLVAILGLLARDSGQRFLVVSVALGLTGWPGLARVVRGQVRSLREQDFVTSARAIGLTEGQVLRRHILPHVLPQVVGFAALAAGGTLLTDAALAFLDIGGAGGRPTWGRMVLDGKNSLGSAPWISLAPAAVILAATVALNLLGEAVSDALDPRRSEGPR